MWWCSIYFKAKDWSNNNWGRLLIFPDKIWKVVRILCNNHFLWKQKFQQRYFHKLRVYLNFVKFEQQLCWMYRCWRGIIEERWSGSQLSSKFYSIFFLVDTNCFIYETRVNSHVDCTTEAVLCAFSHGANICCSGTTSFTAYGLRPTDDIPTYVTIKK